MAMTVTRLAVGLLPGMLLVGSSATASPNVPAANQALPPPVTVAAPSDRVTYMPLDAGRQLTYETSSGDRFSFSFGAATTVRWFDGTERSVVPVTDTRCSCQVLYSNAGGEIRAVGAIEKGRVSTWGEYFVVWPADGAGETETVTTPAGRFDSAVRITMPEGTAWFAPGIGIVKADGYELAEITMPRGNNYGGMHHDGTER
jgi:hypothetical protein